MRRKPKPWSFKEYEITEFYRYLKWTECSKCGDEVRREPMWKVKINGFRWGAYELDALYNNYKVFCKQCYLKDELIKLCDEMTG